MYCRMLRGLLGLVLVFVGYVPGAAGATFVLDPLESSITLSGYDPAGPHYPDRPFMGQGEHSLTSALNGTVELAQVSADVLRINESWIIPSLLKGKANPGRMAAVFAGWLPGEGEFLFEQSYAPLWGELPSAGVAGTYRVGKTQLGFGTRSIIGKEAGDPWWYTDSFGRVLKNVAVGHATLTQSAGRYRLEIPFASIEQRALQDEIVVRFNGQIVAYSDLPPTSTPSVADGRFELGESWTAGDGSSGVVFNPSVTKYTWSLEQQEWGYAALRPDGSTEYFYQRVAGQGMLSSDTLYQVAFDMLNDSARFGSNPYAATAVEVYLALAGVERTGEYDAAGGSYRLEHLSDIAPGEWQRGISLVFDTSHLTPEQLQQELFLVFRATTLAGKSAVNFDNVNLSVVPEPSTLALDLLGVPALLASTRYGAKRLRLSCPPIV